MAIPAASLRRLGKRATGSTAKDLELLRHFKQEVQAELNAQTGRAKNSARPKRWPLLRGLTVRPGFIRYWPRAGEAATKVYGDGSERRFHAG